MSVAQRMFACSGFALIAVLMFTQASPVPVPEDVHPAEHGQFASGQAVQSEGEPAVFERETMVELQDPAAPRLQDVVFRPVRSASPFFGILQAGYEKPYKSHHHHNHQNHHEEYEPEYHHRPQYHHQPQYHGGGAGSYASAGSYAGGHGGGHSQSAANSQSASFGFGPFQASYSASSAHSGSHSRRESDYFDY